MPAPTPSCRRDFLRASVATSAVFGAGAALTTSVHRAAAANAGTAKNVILLVSDGMNHGALSLARQYRAAQGEAETWWTRMYRELPVVRALTETFSANSCVTDSAAAASAWGGGRRVNNGAINILPDGSPLATLHEKLRAAGKRTGLVTTATVTHATPAGFAANVASRADEAVIASQYLERRVDVLLGGGRKFFSPELLGRYRTAGYDVAESRDALLAFPTETPRPLLGVFHETHLPYTIDHVHVPEWVASVPTLTEMTRTALDRLAPHPDGFFLLVEGARIDHAGHANDAAASIHDQLAFDDALGLVLAFAEVHPDTLVVVTTDHGCGGIQMNGVSAVPGQPVAPGLYNASSLSFDRIRGFNRSVEWLKQQGLDGLSGPPLAEALETYTGLRLTADQTKAAQGLKEAYENVIQAHTGIGWTSAHHTGELVEFGALGPGSREFPPLMRNDELHGHVLRILGIGA